MSVGDVLGLLAMLGAAGAVVVFVMLAADCVAGRPPVRRNLALALCVGGALFAAATPLVDVEADWPFAATWAVVLLLLAGRAFLLAEWSAAPQPVAPLMCEPMVWLYLAGSLNKSFNSTSAPGSALLIAASAVLTAAIVGLASPWFRRQTVPKPRVN